MAEIKVGMLFSAVIPVKVFRDLGNGTFDVCTEDGDCFVTVDENLVTNLKQTDMKQMSQAVLATAKDLLKANGKVTTLEIKQQLRRDYPYFYWDQTTVSKYMDTFAGDGVFQYTDNGTYRTYTLAQLVAPVKMSKPTSKKFINKKLGRISTTARPNAYLVISRNKLISYVAKTPNIQGVQLASGKELSIQDIKNQKKSLVGFVSARQHNLQALQVNGRTVYVK